MIDRRRFLIDAVARVSDAIGWKPTAIWHETRFAGWDDASGVERSVNFSARRESVVYFRHTNLFHLEGTTTRIQEIQSAIESLPHKEYIRLRQWFIERDWKEWDKQIEAHAKAGKLDFLVKEALDEKAKGRLKDL